MSFENFKNDKFVVSDDIAGVFMISHKERGIVLSMMKDKFLLRIAKYAKDEDVAVALQCLSSLHGLCLSVEKMNNVSYVVKKCMGVKTQVPLFLLRDCVLLDCKSLQMQIT